MSGLQERQNRETNIIFLKAQRHLYSWAKRYAALNFILSIPLIMLCAFIAKEVPSFEVWYAYISLAVLVMGQILRTISESYQSDAAQVQSTFDLNVLHVTTNDLYILNKVSYEEIKRHADHISKDDNRGLLDWYPTSAANLPIVYGRLVCQRASCYWNFTQRNRYILSLLIISLVAFFVVLAIGLTLSATINDSILFVILPLLPIINWSTSEILAHKKALNLLGCLKSNFERTFDEILNRKITEEELEVRGAQIQDALYIRRVSDPLVPSKLYWLFRDEQESEMQFSADTLVEQISKVI